MSHTSIVGPAAAVTRRRPLTPTRQTPPVPPLTELARASYAAFLATGLPEAVRAASPIAATTGLGTRRVSFRGVRLGRPRRDQDACRRAGWTYAAPLWATAELLDGETGEIQAGEVYLGDVPLLTEAGSLIIHGSERVMIAQLLRAPGAVFVGDGAAATPARLAARVIGERGTICELTADTAGALVVALGDARIPATTLLRALGYERDEHLLAFTADLDPSGRFLAPTLARDPARTADEALRALMARLRPGERLPAAAARAALDDLLFRPSRGRLGRLGRRLLTEAVWTARPAPAGLIAPPPTAEALTAADLVAVLREWLRRAQAGGPVDDVDHLGRRRLRPVGSLMEEAIGAAMRRLTAVVAARLGRGRAYPTLADLLDTGAFQAGLDAFMAECPLVQLRDDTNALSTVSHQRRLSALGPGGLARERAGASERDVHPSQRGRICPVETPEGPNVGLIGALATDARVDEDGLLLAPFRRVTRAVPNQPGRLIGMILRADLADPITGRPAVVAGGAPLTPAEAARIAALPIAAVPVVPTVTDEVIHLTAAEEAGEVIAEADAPLDAAGRFRDDRVDARRDGRAVEAAPAAVTLVDAASRQVVGVGAALIPFLEHDDANRALMGANMQRQAAPLLRPEAPLVGTGLEGAVARASGQLVVAVAAGVVAAATAAEVVVAEAAGGRRRYPLVTFRRTNQETCAHQRPVVRRGERVAAGQVLAEGSSTEGGELALGRNVLVAFMTWRGYTYEDAIVVSERLARDDLLTAIHLEEHAVDARDTPAGPERLTPDVPHVAERSRAHLDARGVARPGAVVGPGDLLVGMVAPRGARPLSPAERLAEAILGDPAGADDGGGDRLRDASLRVPPGARGTVVDVVVQEAEHGDPLPPGVHRRVRVTLARKRKIQVGDKLAGRHGNKGVVAVVAPVADMPFLPDGRSIDVVLNPLGVPSRMNLGQILETHLGWACDRLGRRVAVPAFEAPGGEAIRGLLAAAGLPEDGTVDLYDGRTGEKLAHPVTVGVQYLMRLHHEVEDKIHARSTGPYALVTQQPLGGRARAGGQRFGEMEVWALEAYGAAALLQEMVTLKSDDVAGREQLVDAIVRDRPDPRPGAPASVGVLVQELRALGLDVTFETAAPGPGPPDAER